MIPSIEWTEENKVKMINQTLLPHELKFLEFDDYREVATSIKVMNIRGAPAIGVAAAMGMALATLEYKELSKDNFLDLETIATHVSSNVREGFTIFFLLSLISQLHLLIQFHLNHF